MSEMHEDDFIDRLGEMFERQDALQMGAYEPHTSPRDFDMLAKLEFIKTNVLAATDELHEALGETGWKPWATSKHINVDAYKAELIDAWHFFMNLCIVVDMTPEELYQGYLAKREKNIKRQQEGYDGVSTKCSECGRALDDDAVLCQEDPAHPGFFICYAGVAQLPSRPTDYSGLEPTQ